MRSKYTLEKPTTSAEYFVLVTVSRGYVWDPERERLIVQSGLV